MKNPIYKHLCTVIGALVVVCGTTAAFSQTSSTQLPPHLYPARWEAQRLIFEEGKAVEAIAHLEANQEYLQHRYGQGRFLMSLAHMMLGNWQAAYQWTIPPGWNDMPHTVGRTYYRNLLDAFNGNTSRAFVGMGFDFTTYDMGELHPVYPYLAQGNSDEATKANFAFLSATTSFAFTAVERFLLTTATQLAPDAPLIQMRYASRAEPDVRKAVAILDGLSFPEHKRLQQELEIHQKWHRAALQRAERGQSLYILQNRVLPHTP